MGESGSVERVVVYVSDVQDTSHWISRLEGGGGEGRIRGRRRGRGKGGGREE